MKKVTYILAAHLIAILAFGISQAKAVTINLISQNTSTIGKYKKYEVTFTISQSYSNPFDPCELILPQLFISPTAPT